MGSINLNFGTPQTITTTAGQDAKLLKLAQPAYPTIEAWLKVLLVNMVKDYAATADANDRTAVATAYEAAAAAQQAAVRTALGLP